MKVTIDQDRCQGHLRCYAIAPDFFQVDDLGHATTSPDGDQVPTEIEDKVREAIRNCPERAITIEE